MLTFQKGILVRDGPEPFDFILWVAKVGYVVDIVTGLDAADAFVFLPT
jgi:hypothetical protein